MFMSIYFMRRLGFTQSAGMRSKPYKSLHISYLMHNSGSLLGLFLGVNVTSILNLLPLGLTLYYTYLL